MFFEKDHSSFIASTNESDIQEPTPESTDSIDTTNNTKESYDSVLYDNMIFPS